MTINIEEKNKKAVGELDYEAEFYLSGQSSYYEYFGHINGTRWNFYDNEMETQWGLERRSRGRPQTIFLYLVCFKEELESRGKVFRRRRIIKTFPIQCSSVGWVAGACREVGEGSIIFLLLYVIARHRIFIKEFEQFECLPRISLDCSWGLSAIPSSSSSSPSIRRVTFLQLAGLEQFWIPFLRSFIAKGG